MMIELNEQFASGVTARIQRIFSVTRSIESVVSSGEHFMPQLNLNASLPPEKMQRAQTEIRGKQTWLFCLRVTKRIEPYLYQRKPSPHFLNV